MRLLIYKSKTDKKFIFNMEHVTNIEQNEDCVRIHFDTKMYVDVYGNIDDFINLVYNHISPAPMTLEYNVDEKSREE